MTLFSMVDFSRKLTGQAYQTPQQLSEIFKTKGDGQWGARSWTSILIFLGIVALIFVAIKLYQRIRKYRAYKKDYSQFLRLCEERNLTFHQIKILETLSRKYDILPSHLLSSQKTLINTTLKESKNLLKKYPASHPVYVDFDSNIKHVRSVFFKKKPAFGEMLQSSRDIHAGTPIIVYRKEKKSPSPVKGIILRMDANRFIARFQVPEAMLDPIVNAEKVYIFMNHHGDANYEFPSRVIGKSTVKRGEKEEIHLAFIHSEDLRRKQRRKYIRVRVNFPVAIHQEIVEDRNVPIAVQGNMLDVSEGGCSFVAKHLIRSGVMVNMSFYLEDREMGNILAKIVHTHSSKEGFLHHVSFVELPDEVSYYIKTFVSRHARRRI